MRGDKLTVLARCDIMGYEAVSEILDLSVLSS